MSRSYCRSLSVSWRNGTITGFPESREALLTPAGADVSIAEWESFLTTPANDISEAFAIGLGPPPGGIPSPGEPPPGLIDAVLALNPVTGSAVRKQRDHAAEWKVDLLDRAPGRQEHDIRLEPDRTEPRLDAFEALRGKLPQNAVR